MVRTVILLLQFHGIDHCDAVYLVIGRHISNKAYMELNGPLDVIC